MAKPYIRKLIGRITLASALIAMNAFAAPAPEVAKLSLNWRPLEVQGEQTRAALTLTNTGEAPLGLAGWSLYLSSISAIEPSQPGDGVDINAVAGPLYRLRPAAGQGALAPGASVVFYLEYPEIMVMTDKAPAGPYLVYDDAPGLGVPVKDYQASPLSRAAQVAGAPAGFASAVTPEALYARYADTADIALADLPPVFPLPLSYQYGEGRLNIAGGVKVHASTALAAEVGFARDLLRTGGVPETEKVSLVLTTGPVKGQTSPEAYHLSIDSKGSIQISGASAAGVYYGLQSLRQMIGDDAADLRVVEITDAPRFAYRGLLIDVARNFQSRDKVLEVIDLMARYKLNTLHLHLTDDEGWRIEIPQLPELTSVGAVRGVCVPGDCLPSAYGSGPDVADPHGSGYYTGADYMAILQYAQAHHVEVIPEIEMPGHARAAVMAMAARARRLEAVGDPHAQDYRLNDQSDQSVYHSAQGYSDNVINPGLESVYRFIDTVAGELVALHRQAGVPLRTLQVGGDELADGAWEGSPQAQKAMAGGVTADLWENYYSRVIAILGRYDVKAAGWEELGERKTRSGGETRMTINPQFIGKLHNLYVWNNLGGSEDLAYRLANAGYDVVLAPATNLYFDMAYNRDAAEYGHNWAAYTDLEDVYGFDPLHMTGTDAAGTTGLTAVGQTHVSGLEGTMFSETMRASWRIDYMLMPRMLGLAERAWSSGQTTGGWSVFANQLGKRVLPALDRDRPDLAYRLPPPGLHVADGQVWTNAQMPGLSLRYTTDGSVPTVDSPLVTGAITDKGTVTVSAFSRTGRASRPSKIVNP
ncbi:MAG: family 20 glycosylhydrolase [Asticcacaulis sp.]|uniref:family 20 glycosylhydrolase n=1 Tax=Asticcacaulis sp. TaxID=1872648 RepID=UPI0039E47938